MDLKKISELSSAGEIGANDYLLISQGGRTYKVLAQTLKDFLFTVTSNLLNVTPSGELQIITPEMGEYFDEVIVAAIQTDVANITPSESVQEVFPDAGRYFNRVVVSEIQTEQKTATPKAASQTVEPTAGKYLKKVIIDGDSNLVSENISEGVTIFGVAGSNPLKQRVQNDVSITPTGNYATSTYYDTTFGVKIGYCSDGDILIAMKGGTSTAYENILFELSSAPSGVTIVTDSSTYDTGDPTGNLYVCVLKGITSDVNISIAMNSVSSTYDYVKAAITVQEVES